MAESPVDPMIKYVYQGDFGETVQAAVRPIVIIYEVKDYYYDNLNLKYSFLSFFLPSLNFISMFSFWFKK